MLLLSIGLVFRGISLLVCSVGKFFACLHLTESQMSVWRWCLVHPYPYCRITFPTPNTDFCRRNSSLPGAIRSLQSLVAQPRVKAAEHRWTLSKIDCQLGIHIIYRKVSSCVITATTGSSQNNELSTLSIGVFILWCNIWYNVFHENSVSPCHGRLNGWTLWNMDANQWHASEPHINQNEANFKRSRWLFNFKHVPTSDALAGACSLCAKRSAWLSVTFRSGPEKLQVTCVLQCSSRCTHSVREKMRLTEPQSEHVRTHRDKHQNRRRRLRFGSSAAEATCGGRTVCFGPATTLKWIAMMNCIETLGQNTTTWQHLRAVVSQVQCSEPELWRAPAGLSLIQSVGAKTSAAGVWHQPFSVSVLMQIMHVKNNWQTKYCLSRYEM